MQKTIIIIIALAVVGFGAWYLMPTDVAAPENDTETPPADAVAVVNGEEISREQFSRLETNAAAQQGSDVESLDATTRAALETQVLDTLIAQVLLSQAAEAAGLPVDDAAVEAQVQQVQSQFPDSAAYETALSAEGLTEAEFRADVEQQLRIEAYLSQELDLEALVASEEEITAAYDEAVAGGNDVPPLADVREQVENLVLQEKQQGAVASHLEMLREAAEIEILL